VALIQPPAGPRQIAAVERVQPEQQQGLLLVLLLLLLLLLVRRRLHLLRM